MMQILPVDPLLTNSGAIASLARVMSESEAVPIPLTKSDAPYSNFKISSEQISFSIASKLGVGSIFTGSFDASRRAFYYDAVAYTDKLREDRDSDHNIQMTRWGIGLRINLVAYDIKSDLAVNFGAVAAAVQLGAAKAKYEVIGLGLGLEGFQLVLGNLPSMADFDFAAFMKLENEVVKQLAKFIKERQSALVPVPIAVGLRRPPDLLADGQSILFAMYSIKQRRTLTDVLSYAGPRFDESIVRDVYRIIVGDSPDDGKPSREDVSEAERWIQLQ